MKVFYSGTPDLDLTLELLLIPKVTWGTPKVERIELKPFIHLKKGKGFGYDVTWPEDTQSPEIITFIGRDSKGERYAFTLNRKGWKK